MEVEDLNFMAAWMLTDFREKRKCLFDEGAGGQALLTIADLAWKTLFITALMAPPNQA